ncbi:unnamed protein product [Mytilus coruscus]|uniref:Uncharacterized protein n=1 Tax=Mytilus coruscus TaxID=42192 RepID=A0A6J8C0F9_MYTCO|nr:unnamed protein product [Mytilus coruscus]
MVIKPMNEVKVVRHVDFQSAGSAADDEKSILSDQELSTLGINLENVDVHDDIKLRLKGLVSNPNQFVTKDHTAYVSDLKKRLQFAYKTAEKSAEGTGRRHKTQYDLKVRQSVLEPGDRVLLSNPVPVSSESETISDNQASCVSDSHAPKALNYVQPESEIQVRRSSRQVKPPVRFQDYVRY